MPPTTTAPRTRNQIADAIEAAVDHITTLPRDQWLQFISLFFELLDERDEEGNDLSIIDASAAILVVRLHLGRW